MKLQMKLGIKNFYFIVLSIVLIIEMNPSYKENTVVRYGVIMFCLALREMRSMQTVSNKSVLALEYK